MWIVRFFKIIHKTQNLFLLIYIANLNVIYDHFYENTNTANVHCNSTDTHSLAKIWTNTAPDHNDLL